MMKNLLTAALLAGVLALSGCSLLPEKVDETTTWSAQKLYTEAKDELDSGNYEKAIGYFEKLESRYPFGTYAQQAQMEVAYAHYRQNDAPLALAAIERFIKLHPNHPNVDYMYYLRGLVNFNDKVGMLDFISREDPTERDPKAAREAFDSFKTLVERYPNSIYAKDASDRMAYLVNAMAQYEVHVARYYYRRGAYLAAANRAQFAVREYRQAPSTQEALEIMAKSYEALGLPQLRDDTQRVLQATYKNQPAVPIAPVEKKPWWKIW